MIRPGYTMRRRLRIIQDKSIVNVYIGNFYKDLKQYDSAKVYYRLATMIDPNYEEAYNDLGRACFELKQYDSANYYYQMALQVNPYSAFSLDQYWTGVIRS